MDDERIGRAVGIAKEHGIKTICSKIETRKAHKEMEQIHCDFFQGYFFSEPEILEEQPIRAETGSILMLWNLIRNNASTDELVAASSLYKLTVLLPASDSHVDKASHYPAGTQPALSVATGHALR